MHSLKCYVSSASVDSELDRAEKLISLMRPPRGGFTITYDWTIKKRAHPVEENVSREDALTIQNDCLEGVRAADVIVFLVPPPHVVTRGFWLEYGFAQLCKGNQFLCVNDEAHLKQSVFLNGKISFTDKEFATLLDHLIPPAFQ